MFFVVDKIFLIIHPILATYSYAFFTFIYEAVLAILL